MKTVCFLFLLLTACAEVPPVQKHGYDAIASCADITIGIHRNYPRMCAVR